ncbi:MAG: hypothetical protein GXZ19_11220 [Bacteroidales bacterium]|nr:hypothetical protein [Bacteroidales bacterium]
MKFNFKCNSNGYKIEDDIPTIECNGYSIDHPDFLISQGESDNGDGQSF